MSLVKWKNDKYFSFELPSYVIEQAEFFGYDWHELSNRSYFAWPLYKEIMRMGHKVISWNYNIFRKCKKLSLVPVSLIR